jgi:hypothetical protein
MPGIVEVLVVTVRDTEDDERGLEGVTLRANPP